MSSVFAVFFCLFTLNIVFEQHGRLVVVLFLVSLPQFRSLCCSFGNIFYWHFFGRNGYSV